MGQRVVILGASNTPERFAHRAWRRLVDAGHEVFSVSPTVSPRDGQRVYPDLASVPGPIDTLTVYVNPGVSSGLTENIVALRPGRVIFNPGAENAALARALSDVGITHQNACTLVLLDLDQF